MSKQSFSLSVPETVFTRGSDHALGSFLDITDSRYASTPDDLQGEGYVMEWSELFGFGTNLISATEEDLKDWNKLQQLVDAFIATL